MDGFRESGPIVGDTVRETSRLALMRRISAILGFSVSGIGCLALAGWILDIEALKSVVPGLTSMKVNTALGLLLGGMGVALLDQAQGKAFGWTIAATGAPLAILGVLTLWQNAAGIDLGIDQAFLADPAPGLYPGRMSPMTAVAFLLAGISLMIGRLPFPRSSHALATSLLMLSMVPLLGYAYDVESLYTVGPYSSMALHTALAFHLLALSLLARNSQCRILRLIIADSAGGLSTRRLLPLIPAGIFILGWICALGSRSGWFESTFALALFSMLCIFFVAAIVLWHGGLLHRIDEARSRSAEEVRRLNENLESLVALRTRQLQDSLDHVKTLQGLLPVCAWCKKVRDDQNYWQGLETYLSRKTDARVTHSICPECSQKFKEDVASTSSSPKSLNL